MPAAAIGAGSSRRDYERIARKAALKKSFSPTLSRGLRRAWFEMRRQPQSEIRW